MTSSEFKNKIVPLSPRIYPMLARMLQNDEDARDAVQDIMVKLWKNRRKLSKHPNVSGYVFLTARNHCLDQIKSKRKLDLVEDIFDHMYKIGINKVDDYDGKEAALLLMQIIEGLPDKQKKVLILRDIDGLEFNEIEILTGEKIENIRVDLSRARKKTGIKLTEIYNYEYGKAR